MNTKPLALATAAAAVVFHDKFLGRIAGLNIMDASSVVVAQHLAEDGWTKVPANKILETSEKLLDKMIDVQASESPYVEQVMPFLQKADAGLKAQIADYIKKGDLSVDLDSTDDNRSGVDPAIADTIAGAARADQALAREKMNGGDRFSRAGTRS